MMSHGDPTAASGAIPTVACVVPVYNVAPYLKQCVNSLVGQTLRLVEILLVDDGSTDGSPGICDELSRRYKNVRVLHKTNEGLGHARNVGLDALGFPARYVMFVDSDDWLEPGTIEVLARQAADSGADCVIAGFTKRGNDCAEQFRFQLEDGVYEGERLRRELMPRLCGSTPGTSDSIPMSACAALFSRRVIDECRLRFPSEREVLSEDFFFKWAFLECSERVRVSSNVGYSYRTNDRSLTTSYRPDRFEASMRFHRAALGAVARSPARAECVLRLQKTALINLRACIAQEARRAGNGAAVEACRAVSAMLADGRVREILAEYPVGELRWRQRAFVRLVAGRRAGALLALARMGFV